MKLISAEQVGAGRRVALMMDTDVPMAGRQILDNRRLKKSLLTIKLLREKDCKIMILGHRGRPTRSAAAMAGRPSGKDESLSLRPVYAELMSLLGAGDYGVMRSIFVDDVDRERAKKAMAENALVFMENLRFWPEKEWAELVGETVEVFVNDALAVAHRKGLGDRLRGKMGLFYGLAFVEEIEKLEKIRNGPARPVVVILAGAKKDKLDYIEDLKGWADKIMIAGKLVKEAIAGDEKIYKADLNESGLDISEGSILEFEKILAGAKTVVWAGALGKYEVEEGQGSTKRIAQLIGQNESFWLIAGGDTGASLAGLGVEEKVGLMASGGGATLEFLAKGKLAGVEE